MSVLNVIANHLPALQANAEAVLDLRDRLYGELYGEKQRCVYVERDEIDDDVVEAVEAAQAVCGSIFGSVPAVRFFRESKPGENSDCEYRPGCLGLYDGDGRIGVRCDLEPLRAAQTVAHETFMAHYPDATNEDAENFAGHVVNLLCRGVVL